MKLWITTALIVLMTVMVYPREAKTATTGSELLELCEKETFERVYCLGFIDGAISGLVIGYSSAPIFCIPDSGNLGQFERIVEKYLKEHPEELHEPAAGIVGYAVVEAFPCE